MQVDSYAVVAVFTLVGVLMVFTPLCVGQLLRPHNPYREKNMPYECGKDPIGDARGLFDIRLYVLMLAFLIFDVEFVTMVPPILVFREIGWIAFYEILAFVAVLALGLAYLWRHGHLEWVKTISSTKES